MSQILSPVETGSITDVHCNLVFPGMVFGILQPMRHLENIIVLVFVYVCLYVMYMYVGMYVCVICGLVGWI